MRLRGRARTPILLAVVSLTLLLAVDPARSDYLLIDLNGDTVAESAAALLVQSSYPVGIRTAVLNRDIADSVGFDVTWLTSGPGGLVTSVPAGTSSGVGVIWDWQTYYTVYSLACSTTSTTRPCISFAPSDGGATRGPYAGVPGRSLSSSSVTTTTGSLSASLLIFFSPPQELLRLTSSVRQREDGTFEYETMAENVGGEEVVIEVSEGPLECDTCVNLRDSEEHCGACGNACGDGECCSFDGEGASCVPSNGPCPVCGNGTIEAGETNSVEIEAMTYGESGYRYLVTDAESAPSGFEQPGFDDSDFGTGDAPFGTSTVCGGEFATSWPLDTDLLLRRAVVLPRNASDVRIHARIDNDLRVYWNGNELTDGFLSHENCYDSNPEELAVPDEFLDPSGDNLLAVHARDRGGDSGVDVQVVAVVPEILQSGEECDGTDLGGQTCLDFGFCGGVLGCDAACGFDTSACEPCETTCDPPQALCGEECCDTANCCDVGGGACCTEFEFCDVEFGCVPAAFLDASSDSETAPGIAQVECSSGFENCAGSCEFPAPPIIEAGPLPEGGATLSLVRGGLGGRVRREVMPAGSSMMIDSQISQYPAKEISSNILVCGGSIPGGTVECSGGEPGTLGLIRVLVPDTTKPIGNTFLSPFDMVLTEPSGDGSAQPGETIKLSLSVTDAGPIGIHDVQALLTAPGSPDAPGLEDPIPVTQSLSAYPNIPGFAGTPVSVANQAAFIMTIPPGHPEDTVRPLKLSLVGISDDSGLPYQQDVFFALGVGSACAPVANATGEFDTVQGFLSPMEELTPDGDPVHYPTKAFKQGRTLPLKLRLGCGGLPVDDSVASPPRIVELERIGTAGIDLIREIDDAGSSNDGGTTFRYDGDSGEWKFNLKTSNLLPGRYNIKIMMPNGRIYRAGADLR